MKKNDWKKRDGVVFSTNPDFGFQYQGTEENETLPPGKQTLYISLDKSGRAGKQVTIVAGFIGKPTDLEGLTKLIKTKCGAGGSSKNGEILIQGDVREKVLTLLVKEDRKSVV